MPGYLALVLHAHLPYVRHPEADHFLEEDWLFEAITEAYIPLLQLMQRLHADGIPVKVSMSITPTLCAMLQDDLLRERYVQHLDNLADFCHREVERNRKDPQLQALSQFYLQMFSESRRFFVDQCQCNLINAFRKLRDAGVLEIIACAATHGLLPLLHRQSPPSARAQVLIGRDVYVDTFKVEPAGFWLPECAYAADLAPILQEANLRWFILDSHGLLFAEPRPRRAIYSPCYTPQGPAAFARDQDSSRQVWSAQIGYPGDPNYREFYRDAGFDLPLDHLGPVGRGLRKFSGVKYYRITGSQGDKALYDPAAGERLADAHATHFLEARRRQIQTLLTHDFDPIVVIPFDAELFGHWWFEGPVFLDRFIRKVAGEPDFRLTTPTEFLSSHPTQQTVQPATSTWGEEGHLRVWLDPSNIWLYPHLHGAARRMHEVASGQPAQPAKLTQRVLQQLTRELLLAQASDWAFLMKNGTAKEYASKRSMDHLVRFNQLYDQLTKNQINEEFLRDCEWRDNLFPNVNWRYYI
ncbi:MAG TPA: 1,4-alpha-glucan branching protein domain-containing protein [Chthoniobacterales bacterium]|jgi:1,4-alpha-glucan branching enzyme